MEIMRMISSKEKDFFTSRTVASPGSISTIRSCADERDPDYDTMIVDSTPSISPLTSKRKRKRKRAQTLALD